MTPRAMGNLEIRGDWITCAVGKSIYPQFIVSQANIETVCEAGALPATVRVSRTVALSPITGVFV